MQNSGAVALIVQVIAFAVLLVFFGSYRALTGFWLYWIDFTSSVNFMALFFSLSAL